MSDDEDDDDIATSEQYEEEAKTHLNKHNYEAARVYASLALSATIREATFVLADVLTEPMDDDDDSDSH